MLEPVNLSSFARLIYYKKLFAFRRVAASNFESHACNFLDLLSGASVRGFLWGFGWLGTESSARIGNPSCRAPSEALASLSLSC